MLSGHSSNVKKTPPQTQRERERERERKYIDSNSPARPNEAVRVTILLL